MSNWWSSYKLKKIFSRLHRQAASSMQEKASIMHDMIAPFIDSHSFVKQTCRLTSPQMQNVIQELRGITCKSYWQWREIIFQIISWSYLFCYRTLHITSISQQVSSFPVHFISFHMKEPFNLNQKLTYMKSY